MINSFMAHSLIEFGPLILFFLISTIWGFYPGAAALVISTLAALIFSLSYFKRFAYFSVSVSSLTLFSGGITLYLHQPIWLVLEFTLSNLFFGLALLFAQRRGRLILESMFDHMFSISRKGWRTLTIRWGWVLVLIGVTNQVFWYLCPNEELWTLFRFIVTVLTFIFALSQFSLSKRERLPEASPWGLRR